MTREMMECDMAIVGAGPSGLSAAIRLAQLAKAAGEEKTIFVLEKGAEVGAHIISGAVIEPRALDELIPDWKEKGAPLNVPVTKDTFAWLWDKELIKLPTPPQMKNHGNYIISLANFCRWLGKEAESLGVQIFTGFAGADVIIEDGVMKGVITGDFGVSKEGIHKANYQPGIEIRAKVTLVAEGCRGSLSQRLMDIFNLRAECDPQTYGIGIKEIWQLDPSRHKQGEVVHTVGWPLDNSTYGGSFMYHMENNQLAVGLIVGLDYRNPYLDPYLEFQKFKTHPQIAPIFAGAKRIAYGARALNEGGYQSIPKLAFPGGALIGDAAGFLNVAKIKGTHNAMKSGMLAAEAAFAAIKNNTDMTSYETALKNSWVYDELYKVRNIRPGFHKGLLRGLAYAAFDTYIMKGKASWTLSNHADHTQLRKKDDATPPKYPRPDGVLTFARLDSVFLTATNHEEDQPCHLTLKDSALPIDVNLAEYDAPEQRYCPAGVYEIVQEEGRARLQINAQNCIHCKTCDIKDPTQNIVWVTPEGGGGPKYGNM
ncbi:MAG: electron transfer flavoprotein-ubiquinone oxidoreductase [Rickettsiales bacterium]